MQKFTFLFQCLANRSSRIIIAFPSPFNSRSCSRVHASHSPSSRNKSMMRSCRSANKQKNRCIDSSSKQITTEMKSRLSTALSFRNHPLQFSQCKAEQTNTSSQSWSRTSSIRSTFSKNVQTRCSKTKSEIVTFHSNVEEEECKIQLFARPAGVRRESGLSRAQPDVQKKERVQTVLSSEERRHSV